MEKIVEFERLRDLFRHIKEHSDTMKRYLLPAVVGMALIVFWVFGGEDDLRIESEMPAGQMGSETLSDGSEAAEGDVLPGSESTGSSEMYVDIGGEVENPGVYRVTSDTRLFQVIEQAGGLKETADIDSINRAEPVADGQKIIIGSLDADSPYYTGAKAAAVSGSSETAYSASAGKKTAVRETENGPVVNLNLATLGELQMIPGVGPSTAQKILDYRETHGNYQKISDIKKISGIGDKTYENLKDYIEV